jgi:hypothetical protein
LPNAEKVVKHSVGIFVRIFLSTYQSQSMSHSHGQYSFFDVENQLHKIHELSGFLCRLKQAVDWELFRDALNSQRPPRKLSVERWATAV